jgi:hypothetical protein
VESRGSRSLRPDAAGTKIDVVKIGAIDRRRVDRNEHFTITGDGLLEVDDVDIDGPCVRTAACSGACISERYGR